MASKTRSQLIKTAEALFAAHGFQGVSIRDIASKAKTNVASVNYHFGNKYGLYEAALIQHFEDMKQRMEQAQFYRLSPQKQLLAMCGICEELHKTKGAFIRMIYHVLISEKDARLKLITKKIMDAHIKPLVEHLQFASRKCQWVGIKNKSLPEDSFVFLTMAVVSYWSLFAKEFHFLFGKSEKKIMSEAFSSIHGIIKHFAEEL